ncbi:MAG: hypothetical protein WBI17_03650 [Clostridiaceae bacterium]
MANLLIGIFLILVAIIFAILILYILLITFRNSTPFQKLNGFTIFAVIFTFIGLLMLNFKFSFATIGAILVLLLIRISYVIYIDAE